MVDDPLNLQNSRFFSLIDRNLAAETRSIRTAPTTSFRVFLRRSHTNVRDLFTYIVGQSLAASPGSWFGPGSFLLPLIRWPARDRVQGLSRRRSRFRRSHEE